LPQPYPWKISNPNPSSNPVVNPKAAAILSRPPIDKLEGFPEFARNPTLID
jgi:hypothetical protein